MGAGPREGERGQQLLHELVQCLMPATSLEKLQAGDVWQELLEAPESPGLRIESVQTEWSKD